MNANFVQVAQDAMQAAQRRRDLVMSVMNNGQSAAKAKAVPKKEAPATPARPAAATKRLHANLTPLSVSQKTPSTKTPEPKNPKVSSTPKKELFGS